MAGNADTFRRLVQMLASRPEVRSRAGRVSSGGVAGASLRPNAPRMVTVVLAVVLTIVGIALSLKEIEPVLDLLAKTDLELTKELGWWALIGSPVLLLLGSFFRGL